MVSDFFNYKGLTTMEDLVKKADKLQKERDFRKEAAKQTALSKGLDGIREQANAAHKDFSFTILKSKNTSDLSANVNVMITLGWRPIGSPVFDGDPDNPWKQSMYDTDEISLDDGFFKGKREPIDLIEELHSELILNVLNEIKDLLETR